MQFVGAKIGKQTVFHHQELQLAADDLVCMKGRRLFRIKCGSGRIWITWPNQSEVILDSGQSVAVSTRGKICIWAFHDSSVQVWRGSKTELNGNVSAGFKFNR